MKAVLFWCVLVFVFPVLLLAQPVISNNEYYDAGDVFHMVICDPSLGAGAPGASQTWDFSGLNTVLSLSTIQVLHDTTTAFGSNLMIILPNGNTEHVQETNTDSYINGVIVPGSSTVFYYNNFDNSKRPFSYLSSYIDSYRVNIPSSSSTGAGQLTVTADAYGKLILPYGTFNNVLRIRKYLHETDTVGTPAFTSLMNQTSYLWFDGIHTAPLFEIDSEFTSTTGETQRAMYLASSEGIGNQNSIASGYSGFIDNTWLNISGNFDPGITYNVTMIDLAGRVILKSGFNASGNSCRFEIKQQLVAGVYVVCINPADDNEQKKFIKVTKI